MSPRKLDGYSAHVMSLADVGEFRLGGGGVSGLAGRGVSCTNAHRSPRLHPPFCCRRHHDRRLPHLSGLRASTHSCGGSGAPTRSRRLGGSTHPWQTRPRTLTFHDPTAALSGEDGRLKRLVTS